MSRNREISDPADDAYQLILVCVMVSSTKPGQHDHDELLRTPSSPIAVVV